MRLRVIALLLCLGGSLLFAEKDHGEKAPGVRPGLAVPNAQAEKEILEWLGKRCHELAPHRGPSMALFDDEISRYSGRKTSLFRSLRHALDFKEPAFQKDHAGFSTVVSLLRTYIHSGAFLSTEDPFRAKAIAAVKEALAANKDPDFAAVLQVFADWLDGHGVTVTEDFLRALQHVPLFYAGDDNFTRVSRLCGLASKRESAFGPQARDEVRELAMAMAFLLDRKGDGALSEAAARKILLAGGEGDDGLRDAASAELFVPYVSKKYGVPGHESYSGRIFARAVLSHLGGKERPMAFSKKEQLSATEVRNRQTPQGRRILVDIPGGCPKPLAVDTRIVTRALVNPQANLSHIDGLAHPQVEFSFSEGISHVELPALPPEPPDYRNPRVEITLRCPEDSRRVVVNYPQNLPHEVVEKLAKTPSFETFGDDGSIAGVVLVGNPGEGRALVRRLQEAMYDCTEVDRSGIGALLKKAMEAPEAADFLQVQAEESTPFYDSIGTHQRCHLRDRVTKKDTIVHVVYPHDNTFKDAGTVGLPWQGMVGNVLAGLKRKQPLVMDVPKPFAHLALSNVDVVRPLPQASVLREDEEAWMRLRKLSQGQAGSPTSDVHSLLALLAVRRPDSEYDLNKQSIVESTVNFESLAAGGITDDRLSRGKRADILGQGGFHRPALRRLVEDDFESNRAHQAYWAKNEDGRGLTLPHQIPGNLDVDAVKLALAERHGDRLAILNAASYWLGGFRIPAQWREAVARQDFGHLQELMVSRDSDLTAPARANLTPDQAKQLEDIWVARLQTGIPGLLEEAVRGLLNLPSLSAASLRVMGEALYALERDRLQYLKPDRRPRSFDDEAQSLLNQWAVGQPDFRSQLALELLADTEQDAGHSGVHLRLAAARLADPRLTHLAQGHGRVLAKMAERGETSAVNELLDLRNSGSAFAIEALRQTSVGATGVVFHDLNKSIVSRESNAPSDLADSIVSAGPKVLPAVVKKLKELSSFVNRQSVEEAAMEVLVSRPKESLEALENVPDEDLPPRLQFLRNAMTGIEPHTLEKIEEQSKDLQMSYWIAKLKFHGRSELERAWPPIVKMGSRVLSDPALPLLADADEPIRRKFCELALRQQQVETLAEAWGEGLAPCVRTWLRSLKVSGGSKRIPETVTKALNKSPALRRAVLTELRMVAEMRAIDRAEGIDLTSKAEAQSILADALFEVRDKSPK